MVYYRLGSYFRLGSGAGTITTLVLALLLVLLQVTTTVVTVGHTTVKPLPTTPSPTSTTRYLLNGNVVSDRVTDPKVQPATVPNEQHGAPLSLSNDVRDVVAYLRYKYWIHASTTR